MQWPCRQFALDFNGIVVPGVANPVLPGDLKITANLALSGCTSTPTFACGLINGATTSPLVVPVDGSTWALVPLPTGTDPATLTLLTTCPAPPASP
jgi:hypothetical protein